MKSTILFVGSSVGSLRWIRHYAIAVNRDYSFEALIKTSAGSALGINSSEGATVKAVVAHLMDYYDSGFTREETGDYVFAGAVLAKRLRKVCPNARFFLIGSERILDSQLEPYVGEIRDITLLPPGHMVTPDTLLDRIKMGVIPGYVPSELAVT